MGKEKKAETAKGLDPKPNKKGFKPKGRGHRKGEVDETATNGVNDVSWLNKFKQLVQNVINIPFNHISGTPIQIQGPTASSTYNQAVPGIAVIDYISTIGKSLSDSDPFNMQMRDMWLTMHRKYRGMGGYQKSDLGITMLCIASLFSTVAWAERIYGACNSYEIRNRNMPFTLFEALGIDVNVPDDLANFRYQINLVIKKMKALCLPKGFDYMYSDVVLNSFIFKDSPGPRAQFFLYQPQGFYLYDATALSTGGCAKYHLLTKYATGSTPSGGLGWTVTDIVQILNLMADALLNDDDVAKQCSDILAVVGEDTAKIITLSYLAEDWTVDPIYDYERHVQFHNLNLVPYACGVYDRAVITATDANSYITAGIPLVVYQNNNVVKCELCASNSSQTYYEFSGTGKTCASLASNNANTVMIQPLFDIWVDNPGEVELLAGTRFKVAGAQKDAETISGAQRYYQEIYTFGTNVCTKIHVFSRGVNGMINEYTSDDLYSISTNLSGNEESFVAYLSQFDKGPVFYHFASGGWSIFGNLDNFKAIDSIDLAAIHDAVTLSLFSLPEFTSGIDAAK